MKTRSLMTITTLVAFIAILNLILSWKELPVQVNPSDVRQSVVKSFLLLEKTGYLFTERNHFKCAGCHHTTLTSMVAEEARQKGIPVIDSFSEHRVSAMVRNLQLAGNPNIIDQFLTINFNAPYALLGLYSEKYPPDVYTDISVDYTMSQAKADGSFLAESGRVPLQSGDIHCTAFSIRAIELYASPSKKDRVDALVKKTRHWLETQNPGQQQEIVFQLLGMQWCGSSKDQMARVAQKLLSMQQIDGGWSQLTTMESDAYATGQALYALFESGMSGPADDAYQKGMNYLLKTQDPTGAWIVQTRSYGVQPYFSSDFPPNDENQFISAAATNWADLALLESLPDK
jgi:Prenyltransferase and squalene oxidase repeat